MVLNVHRNLLGLLGTGRREERGYGGVCVGGGGGIIYLSLHCHHQNMTSELRWAAMRAILMFHNCEGQSHNTVSTDHNL